MNVATALNIKKTYENEARRDRVAAWYVTLPGIIEEEKTTMTKSLQYNLGKELARLVIVYMVLSLLWAFGYAKYDPFKAITGYELMGKKTVEAVVQEDGSSILLKDPNKGEHVSYTLAALGIDPTGRSYGDRFVTYWGKNSEDTASYELLVILDQKQTSRIENLYYAVFLIGYLAILCGGLLVFFVRRKKYTGWFRPFYDRLEKYYSEYGVYEVYNAENGYDLVDAVIAYAERDVYKFVNEFSRIRLTTDEIREKEKHIRRSVAMAVCIMAAILLVINLVTTVNFAVKDRANQARTASVCQELQEAIEGNMDALGDASEYYNYSDMVERMRDSFPGEAVYYKLLTTEDYVALITTTSTKKNVYLDRYVPEEGKIGEKETVYTLEISMVSDAIQPDDILHDYTGYLK